MAHNCPDGITRIALCRKCAALMLCLSVRTIDNLISAGQLKPTYIGSSVRIPVAQLERLVGVLEVSDARRTGGRQRSVRRTTPKAA